MTERIPHPSRDELQAFALGQLDDAASGVVAEHLGECEPCEVTLATLANSGDTLVAALRAKTAPAPFEQEPELSVVLNQASAIALSATVGKSDVAAPDEAMLGGTSEAKAADGVEKLPFSRIRDYQLLEKLGAGGMGAVYKALHTQLDKVVAIKLLPAERTQDEAAVARFRREMKAVGKLDHPHIVRALDAGQHEGRHFLVIEHVEGEDLSKIARRLEQLPIPEACEVVRQAALGLQHAYEHGLVHRDIKPSNLMLSVVRGPWSVAGGHHQQSSGLQQLTTDNGQRTIVKVLDLGLALLSGSANELKELTSTGQLMGTIDYMAPEQGDDSHAVDIRADIYSLGATLYRLLSGEAPFGGGKYNTPVKKVMALANEPPTPIRQRRPDVPEALAAIVHRMLEKQPARRFATPTEVAAALQQFTAGCDLTRLVATADVAASCQLASGRVVAVEGKNPALGESGLHSAATDATLIDQASRAASDVGWPPSAVQSVGTKSQPTKPSAPGSEPHPATSGSSRPPARSNGLRWTLAAAVLLVVLGPLSYFAGTIIRVATNKGELVIKTDDPNIEVTVRQEGATILNRRTDRWYELKAGEYEIEITEKPDGIRLFAKNFVLTRGDKETVNVTLELAKVSKLPAPGTETVPASAVALSSPLGRLDPAAIPDEQRFAWQPKELVAVIGEHRHRHWHGTPNMAFSPDGKLLASAGYDNCCRVWDATTLRELHVLPHGNQVSSVAFSPDGKTLAFGGLIGEDYVTIRLWNMNGLDLVEMPGAAAGRVMSVAFAPDGKTIASGDQDGTVRLWDLKGPKPRQRFERRAHTSYVMSLAFAPNGETLASGSSDKTVRLWDLAGPEPKERGMPLEHPDGVSSVAFTLDGKTLASTCLDGNLRLWDIIDPQPKLRRVLQEGKHCVAMAPAGKLAASSSGNRVYLWDLEAAEDPHLNVYEAEGSGLAISALAFSPDRKNLATASDNCTVRLWDFARAKPKEENALNEHAYSLRKLAFSPDGKMLATGGGDRTVRLWGLTGNEPKEWAVLEGHQAPVNALAFSPGGKLVAYSGTHDPTLRISQVTDSGAQKWLELSGHIEGISSVAFLPESKTLASGHGDGKVRIWDLSAEPPKQILVLKNPNSVHSVAFSPDGKMLAIGSSDYTVRLWDLTLPEPKERSVAKQTGEVYAVAFAPDGRTLASGGVFNLRLWDLVGGELQERAKLDVSDVVRSLGFAPDGKTLVTGGEFGHLILWDVARGKQLRKWDFPGRILDVAFAPDGQHLATANGNGTAYILRLSAGMGVPNAISPDRRAAEYALSIGGVIGINDQWQDIRAATELPKDPFRLTAVDFRTKEQLRDTGLAYFKDCKNLQSLFLNNSQVTDAGLADLTGLPSLRYLSLFGTAITDAGLVHIKPLRQLSELNLHLTSVTDEGLAHLAGLTELSYLDLGNTRITDAGLAHLSGLTKLRFLNIATTDILGPSLQHFRNLKELEFLNSTAGDGYQYLKDLPKLSRLVVSGSASDATVDQIVTNVPKLAEFWLNKNDQVSDVALRRLKELKHLRKLRLDRETPIPEALLLELHVALPKCEISVGEKIIFQPTPDGIENERSVAEWVLSVGGYIDVLSEGRTSQVKSADQLPKQFVITAVHLDGAPVTDSDLGRLKSLTSLEYLHLNGTKISDAGLVHLTGLRSLIQLGLQSTAVTDAGLVHIKQLQQLQSLVVNNTTITDQGLAHLAGMIELRALGLGNTRITDAGMVHLKALSKLQEFVVTGTNVAGPGLRHFKDLKDLESLSSAAGDGFEHLKDLPKLSYLLLSARTSDATVEQVVTNLPKLANLYLLADQIDGTQVSDTALLRLKELKHLRKLRLVRGMPIPEAIIVELQSALPECEILIGADAISPDRRAAEYVLSIGGTLRIKENGEERSITAVAELPRGAFELTALNCHVNPKVNDAGLAAFKECKNLTVLCLSGTQVSDAGLTYFKDCKNLTDLDLNHTRVGDAGLANFKDCKNLTLLHLQGCTQVSDAGLEQLAGYPKLGSVNVKDTKVTETGVKKLSAALPGCKIQWDGGVIEGSQK